MENTSLNSSTLAKPKHNVGSEDRMMRKVFVDYVPIQFTQDTLYDHFRKCGPIEEIAIFSHRKYQSSHNYAFIIFLKAKDCCNATKVIHPIIQGYKLYVVLAAIGSNFSGFHFYAEKGIIKTPSLKRLKKLKKKKNRKRNRSTHHHLTNSNISSSNESSQLRGKPVPHRTCSKKLQSPSRKNKRFLSKQSKNLIRDALAQQQQQQQRQQSTNPSSINQQQTSNSRVIHRTKQSFNPSPLSSLEARGDCVFVSGGSMTQAQTFLSAQKPSNSTNIPVHKTDFGRFLNFGSPVLSEEITTTTRTTDFMIETHESLISASGDWSRRQLLTDLSLSSIEKSGFGGCNTGSQSKMTPVLTQTVGTATATTMLPIPNDDEIDAFIHTPVPSISSLFSLSPKMSKNRGHYVPKRCNSTTKPVAIRHLFSSPSAVFERF